MVTMNGVVLKREERIYNISLLMDALNNLLDVYSFACLADIKQHINDIFDMELNIVEDDLMYGYTKHFEEYCGVVITPDNCMQLVFDEPERLERTLY